MEVKRKTNTGRTIKSRSKTTGFELQLAQEQENFFRTKSGHTDGKWKFATKINFHRITLVSFDPPERMTFDLDLTFMNHQESKALNNLIVAEVKQGSKAPSHFIHAMKQRHIHPFSISKYCLGLSMLNPGLKQNLFKKQQTIIQKIQNRA